MDDTNIYTLEDNNDYVELSRLIDNNNTYLLLSKVGDFNDICIRKIKSDDLDNIYKLDELEYKRIQALFLEMYKDLIDN